MCGIAGWYRRDGARMAEPLIRRQTESLLHRGPDSSGTFVDGDFGFGMRRLSIIDIAHGDQPLRSTCGRYVIVYNGEIYNHQALRRDLRAAGHAFATRCDTEVALVAWQAWGDQAWLRLDGMFSIAIWDTRDRRLVLARDALGIKPLYLTMQRGGLAFASELRALCTLPDLSFTIDHHSVHEFFRFGQIEPPSSIYSEVHSLPAGHVLTMGPTGPARLDRFWKPRLYTAPPQSDRDWIEETRERLLASVKAQIQADVPVATFLSGGVDSSAVTAAMARLADIPVSAFTIALPGNAMNEAQAAARTAAHLGCRHEVLDVSLDEARDAIPAIQASFDEPLGTRGGVILSWYLCRFAASRTKVVLCGDGGDEVFGGYKRQRNALLMARWQPLLRLAAPVLRKLGTRGEKLRDGISAANGFQRFVLGTQISSLAQRQRLFTPAFQAEHERSAADLAMQWFGEADWREAGMLEQFMLGDLLVHMPGGPLARLDRTSMIHSLEARVPLLSRELVDWSLTVPPSLKLRQPGKYLLREAVRPWLPEGILERPKQGFQIPLANWFTGDLWRFGMEAWRESGLAQAGILQADEVDRLFARHRAGEANHAKLLYAITTLACWWQGRRGQPVAASASGSTGAMSGSMRQAPLPAS